MSEASRHLRSVLHRLMVASPLTLRYAGVAPVGLGCHCQRMALPRAANACALWFHGSHARDSL